MTDFSLLDLREFLSVAETYDRALNEFSVISLRLALQRVCEEMKITQFRSFLQLYSQSSALRYAVKRRLATHPRELCRDVDAWKFVIENNRALLGDANKRILIIDNSFMSETASLFICASFLRIAIDAKVEWVNSLSDQNNKKSVQLNSKELEAAQANVERLGINLRHFMREEGQLHVFDFPCDCIAAKVINRNQAIPQVEEKYDLIISQNNSLVLNFAVQERFFKACYDTLNFDGKLFLGSKENINNSSVAPLMRQPFTQFRYFEKYAN